VKLQARKRFGQHFLADRGIIDDIVAAIGPKPGQALVEIGPGLGALTLPLIERSERGRWTIFAAYLGNGIAAYRLSEHFRNVDRRDTEASRFLNLARANNYTPPRQLEQGR